MHAKDYGAPYVFDRVPHVVHSLSFGVDRSSPFDNDIVKLTQVWRGTGRSGDCQPRGACHGRRR